MHTDKDQFQEAIKQLDPIINFPEGLQNQAIEFAHIMGLESGQLVFEEGETDDYLYYLLEGELELHSTNQNRPISVVAGTKNATQQISRLQPRQFSAMAKTPITLFRLNRSQMATLMSSEISNTLGGANYGGSKSEFLVDIDSHSVGGEESGDWMTKILQTQCFSGLPTENIQQLFILLEAVPVKAGDVIIKQGQIGRYYYIVQEGKCQITRLANQGKKPIKLANVSIGGYFGEESLITGNEANATVHMLTNGILMRLRKENFMELVTKPALNVVSFPRAYEMVEQGSQWIDVRFPSEYQASHIKSSINMPLSTIRIHMNKMDLNKHYIIYCDTGQRSSAAAFLVKQLGFDASYAEGGLDSYPEALTYESKLDDKDQSEANQKVEAQDKLGAKAKAKANAQNKLAAKAKVEAYQNKLAAKAKAKVEVYQDKLAAKAKVEAYQDNLAAEVKQKVEAQNKLAAKAKAKVEVYQDKLAAKAKVEAYQNKLAAEVNQKVEAYQNKLAAKAKAKAKVKAHQDKLAAEVKQKVDAQNKLAAEAKVKVHQDKLRRQTAASNLKLVETKKLQEDVAEQDEKQVELEGKLEKQAKELVEDERATLKQESIAKEKNKIAEELDIIQQYKQELESAEKILKQSLEEQSTKSVSAVNTDLDMARKIEHLEAKLMELKGSHPSADKEEEALYQASNVKKIK